MTAHTADVGIVGGGPVGLYLALALLAEGLEPRVLERHAELREPSSRSIGVHPPSIELFDEIGIGDAFLAEAVLVRRGLAFGAKQQVGEVSFDACPGPHRFVATLEQWKTESLLRGALRARAPDALVRGYEVSSVQSGEGGVTIRGRRADGAPVADSFRAVIGADGKRSAVRAAIGTTFEGATYDGDYLMADADDETALGDSAAVFLTEAGLVESFPLPEHRRRWVARRAPAHEGSDRPARALREELAGAVAARAGLHVAPLQLTPPTVFRAEHRLAGRLSAGRVALVGDAAHIVSPIGGQGMNLGWLGARSLAKVLARELRAARDPSAALAKDALRRRAIAITARRRAEMNMWLGRPTPNGRLRDRTLRALLSLPTRSFLARAFTMRHLELGI